MGGRCQGFGQRRVTTSTHDPELDVQGAFRAAVQSETAFFLDRDYSLPMRQTTSLPGPVVAGVQTWRPDMRSDMAWSSAIIGELGGPEVVTLWPAGRDTTEYGPTDTDASRGITIDVRTDPWGHVVSESHRMRDCAAIPASWQRALPDQTSTGPSCHMSHIDDVRIDYRWVSNPDHTHFVISSMTTSGWDEAEQAFLPIERGEFGYDGLPVGSEITSGLLTLQRVMSGPPSALDSDMLEWAFAHTSRGAIIEVLGPAGFREARTWGYGDAILQGKVNGEGHAWESKYPDGMGRLTVSRDPNGVFEQMSWDVHGRPLEQRTTPVGGQTYLVSKWQYSDVPAAAWSSQTLMHYDAPGSAARPRTRYELLDGFGDTVQTWEPAESGSIVTETWRDIAGHVVRTSYPHRVGGFSSDLDVTRDARYLSWRELDGFGRPIREYEDHTAGLGLVRYAYGPGWTWRGTDGGYEKIVHEDTRGQLISVFDGQAPPSGIERYAHYRYDARGRVAVFTDADANRYDYRYDGAGRLREVGRTASRTPVGGSLLDGQMYWNKQDPVLGDRLEYPDEGPQRQTWYSYEYDGPYPIEMWEGPVGSGLLAVEWWYDSLGRPLLKHVRDRATSTFDAYTWTWDQQWLGSRDEITDPWGRTTYNYGPDSFGDRGRLLEVEREWWNGRTATFKYYYDFEGRPLQTAWPSGAVVTAQYTSNTRWLSSHTVTTATGASTILYYYDEWGQLRTFFATAPDNGHFRQTTSRPTPTRIGSIAWVTYDRQADGTSTTKTRDIDYVWQPNGLLESKEISGVGRLDYGYDGARRLVAVRLGGTLLEGYSYDPLGNLTEMYTQSGGTREYTPGRFSEPVKRRTVGTNAEDRHTWDPQGRLASWDTISGSGATTAQRDYAYDGMGRLEMVSRAQGYSIYGYDADDQMVVERHSTNGLTVNDTVYRFQGLRTRITYGIATTEDLLPFVASLNGELRWRLVEPDGHALETFRHGGQRESFEVLGAYGLPVAATPTGDWAIDGFHGQQEDNRNSLVPMGVRHMVLRDGMWMQPEPLLYLGPTNGNLLEPMGYTGVYAGGMPTVLQDRSGRFSWAIAGLRQAASERSGKPLEQVSVVDIVVESVTSTYEAVFPAAYAPTPTTQGQPRTIGQEIEATLFWAAPLAGAVGGAYPLGEGICPG